MPSSRQARMMRTAISPRFAMRSLRNIASSNARPRCFSYPERGEGNPIVSDAPAGQTKRCAKRKGSPPIGLPHFVRDVSTSLLGRRLVQRDATWPFLLLLLLLGVHGLVHP